MRDKYKYIKRKIKNKINLRTNVPKNIPKCATEHLSLRITPSLKSYFRNQSRRQKLSMTKYVLNIFDCHLDHHLSNEFSLDNHTHMNNGKHKEETSVEDSYWNGLQKVWNFAKSV